MALSILKQVMEEKVVKTNVDVVTIAPNYHLYSEEEVQAIIERF